MKKLDILLPFSLPPKELARDLLAHLKLPTLATLLSRAQSDRPQHFDEFAHALPHEMWLARQFDINTPADSSPAIAHIAMRGFNLPAQTGHWFVLHPAHIHIARDHLVLTDIRQVRLSEADALTLFNSAKPLFEDAGKTLLYGDANTWFMRADEWTTLRTSTPDATCGHNIDIWMPRSDDGSARAWRKLQNEVQMQWFENTLNEERAAQGLQVINSLWMWGGQTANDTTTEIQAEAHSEKRYSHTYNLQGWPRCLTSLSAHHLSHCNAAELIADAPQQGLLLLDTLTAPTLTSEWSVWQQQLQTLETDWLTPLLQTLENRQLDQLALIMTDNTRMTEFNITRLSLKKFWVKPTLKKLSVETSKGAIS